MNDDIIIQRGNGSITITMPDNHDLALLITKLVRLDEIGRRTNRVTHIVQSANIMVKAELDKVNILMKNAESVERLGVVLGQYVGEFYGL